MSQKLERVHGGRTGRPMLPGPYSPRRSPSSSNRVAELNSVPAEPSGYWGWDTASTTGPSENAAYLEHR